VRRVLARSFHRLHPLPELLEGYLVALDRLLRIALPHCGFGVSLHLHAPYFLDEVYQVIFGEFLKRLVVQPDGDAVHVAHEHTYPSQTEFLGHQASVETQQQAPVGLRYRLPVHGLEILPLFDRLTAYPG